MADLSTLENPKVGLAEFSLKDAIVAIPLVASALALTFDVGYFLGTDINYFTAFSIAEHLTFAVEIFPAALIATLLAIIVILLVRPVKHAFGSKDRTARKIVAIGIITISLGLVLALMFVLYGRIFFSTTGTLLACAVTSSLLWKDRDSLGIVAIAVFLVSMVLALGSGVDVARAYRANARFPYTVQADQELKAKVVRSGERGLLFYEAQTQRLILLPWSQIKGVALDKN
ncbi:hypothetical protein [Bradyrhizobium ottawaense]